AYWRDITRPDKQTLAWRDAVSPGDIISLNLGSASNSGPQQAQINPQQLIDPSKQQSHVY
ncbi:hypothetical protein A2U01_0101344, partial [Trifolium medium]|nr:hypothetical protein [Trifolium medium]